VSNEQLNEREKENLFHHNKHKQYVIIIIKLKEVYQKRQKPIELATHINASVKSTHHKLGNKHIVTKEKSIK